MSYAAVAVAGRRTRASCFGRVLHTWTLLSEERHSLAAGPATKKAGGEGWRAWRIGHPIMQSGRVGPDGELRFRA